MAANTGKRKYINHWCIQKRKSIRNHGPIQGRLFINRRSRLLRSIASHDRFLRLLPSIRDWISEPIYQAFNFKRPSRLLTRKEMHQRIHLRDPEFRMILKIAFRIKIRSRVASLKATKLQIMAGWATGKHFMIGHVRIVF